ncbi:GRAM domain-containing protein [Blastopirellula marina]|uniref:Uncharacterized protein n=1 Tax=Blastopirellula marina TaxID=124 RepID=A0A2S8G7E1_9BACT|nr:GRAM domain-containing protein [Blastopirellula marina]PQO40210.1 hypothetical protein C5Y98_06300 [Blastopirellula marina]PTL45577.1 hypothetical protein C5Y97_06300 [Blastopirellula marina]
MKTPLQEAETVVKEGPANMQRGIEMVGGRLCLTSQRLIFESHMINIQTGVTIVDLTDVAGATPGWTKFFNLIPLVPNAVCVDIHSGQEMRLTVFGRSQWIDAIEQAVLALRTGSS